ncbi:hypothetical protein HK405_007567, partial [Cladochytrium tenue]
MSTRTTGACRWRDGGAAARVNPVNPATDTATAATAGTLAAWRASPRLAAAAAAAAARGGPVPSPSPDADAAVEALLDGFLSEARLV